MKKTDFDMFKVSLNLNIEIDNSLRRITEKIKLLSQMRDSESLRYVSQFLADTDSEIDNLIDTICKDEA